jgi:hypothetical protein
MIFYRFIQYGFYFIILSQDSGFKSYMGRLSCDLVDVAAISGDDVLQAWPECAAGPLDNRLT